MRTLLLWASLVVAHTTSASSICTKCKSPVFVTTDMTSPVIISSTSESTVGTSLAGTSQDTQIHNDDINPSVSTASVSHTDTVDSTTETHVSTEPVRSHSNSVSRTEAMTDHTTSETICACSVSSHNLKTEPSDEEGSISTVLSTAGVNPTIINENSIPVTNHSISSEDSLILSNNSEHYTHEEPLSLVDVQTSTISTSTSTSSFQSSVTVVDANIPGMLPVDLENIPSFEINNSSNNASNDTIEECHFMSFEEWKKQKVENDSVPNNFTLNHTVVNINRSDYTNSSLSATNLVKNLTTLKKEEAKLDKEDGKVYKDKFNYASADCAATVVKTNSEAKGALAILHENKDLYLLNQCSVENKFVVIELCQDILVDSIVIGNFEFFSSMYKDIRILVSDRFPSQNWKVLGDFQAENIRDVQVFKIQNPLIWARYLKLEIISHYGNEFYCPISLVRVHGKTMMEEFKEEEPQNDPKELELEISELVTAEECTVVLPHLRLNEFLQDLNSTCDALFTPTNDIPQTQESIYKNIMKRISLLESNASLSLLYIEEQSKLLSTAFTNLERRHLTNFATLIENFNSSIISHLNYFKRSYSTMQSEYENLRSAQQQTFRKMLRETREKMDSEISFHKTLSIFNTFIILCLLVYVVLSRDVYVEYELKKRPKRVFPVGKRRGPRR